MATITRKKKVNKVKKIKQKTTVTVNVNSGNKRTIRKNANLQKQPQFIPVLLNQNQPQAGYKDKQYLDGLMKKLDEMDKKIINQQVRTEPVNAKNIVFSNDDLKNDNIDVIPASEAIVETSTEPINIVEKADDTVGFPITNLTNINNVIAEIEQRNTGKDREKEGKTFLKSKKIQVGGLTSWGKVKNEMRLWAEIEDSRR